MTHCTSSRGRGSKAQFRGVGLALLAVLAPAGCSVSTPWSNNASAASRSAELIQEAKDEGASEAQLAALSDGKVTFTEYKDAIHNYLDCLRAAGMTVEGSDEVDGTGRLQYSISWSAPGLSAAQQDEIDIECYATHGMFVDTAYQDALFD